MSVVGDAGMQKDAMLEMKKQLCNNFISMLIILRQIKEKDETVCGKLDAVLGACDQLRLKNQTERLTEYRHISL